MPNWCSNRVVISGPDDVLAAVKAKVRSETSRFDFDSIVPMPPILREIRTGGCEIEGVRFTAWREVDDGNGGKKKVGLTPEEARALDAEHGAHDWYEWSCQNWGTKWNVEDVNFSPAADADGIECSFDTAWAPPTPVLTALAAMFPEVSIVHFYVEEGVGFGGIVRYAGGILQESTESEGRGVSTLSEWHEDVTHGSWGDESEDNEDEEEEE